MSENDSEYKIKIAMFGPNDLKRKILNAYFDSKKLDFGNYEKTLGVIFCYKSIDFHDGKRIGCSIWDINSKDAFKRVAETYKKSATGAVHVLEETDIDSLDAKLNEIELSEKVDRLIYFPKKVSEEKKTDLDSKIKKYNDSGINITVSEAGTESFKTALENFVTYLAIKYEQKIK